MPDPVGDSLLGTATHPAVARAFYGFWAAGGRAGGAQLANPRGFSWPVSDFTNCCTFAVMALQLLQDALGLSYELTLDDWKLGMLNTADRRGPVKLAERMGLTRGVVQLTAGDVLERGTAGSSAWYVAQGWVDSDGDGDVDGDDHGGHSLFLRVLSNGRIITLEARGRARGGALAGQNGVGSRCLTTRNARDWPRGRMAADGVQTLTEADLLKTWPELYVARLVA